MRFFAVIMCICFLGLSYPFVAETDCKAKTEQETSGAEDEHQHEQSEKDCATSCINYCCSSSIILQHLTYSLIAQQSCESLESPAYYKFYCKEPSFSIWQPPKIA